MEKKILLIVDDDDGVREALRSVIEFLYEDHVHSGSLDVLTAADGDEAVDACREQQPALMLMDVNMPGMDGIEAFYAIMELSGGPPVNTVFLTGHAGSGGVRHRLEKAIEDGAHGYIFKPAMAADLKKTIDQLLQLGPSQADQADQTEQTEQSSGDPAPVDVGSGLAPDSGILGG